MALPRYRRAALAAAAIGVLALTACGSKSPEPNASPTGQGQFGTPDATQSAPGATGTPTAGQTTTTTTAATQTTTQPPTGPHIVFFRVKTNPSCPAGTDIAPIPGNPVTIEWQVAGGATGTTLAIDGPGLYGSYGVAGSETLFFSCNGAPNTFQTHTYTLTTVGGGQARSQTLTVQAKINEIPIV